MELRGVSGAALLLHPSFVFFAALSVFLVPLALLLVLERRLNFVEIQFGVPGFSRRVSPVFVGIEVEFSKFGGCGLKVHLKFQISQILKSRNCPVLNLISVLQCFSQIYEIAPVMQCCRAASRLIPDRCLDACAPNFKLSFKHIRCIENVVDIYDCYRTLFSFSSEFLLQ